jgi:hypothetical protein
MADDEKVTAIEPIHGLRTQALRPFGAEERFPRRDLPQKKRRQPQTKDALVCTVTPEKVDCKI